MQENRIEAKDSEVALTIGQTGHVWKRLLCFVFVSHSSLVCVSPFSHPPLDSLLNSPRLKLLCDFLRF